VAAANNDVTQLLFRLSKGDRMAESELIEIVLPQLRRIAAHYMRFERPEHTLQPTALVNEAYLRLVRCADINWESRAHFFGIAAMLMRQILVDHARTRNAGKRPRATVSLDEVLVYSKQKCSEVLALDEALRRLSIKDERIGKVVELRFFGGLTFDQIAGILGVSEKTAKRDWQLARVWLQRELETQ
jgi:RNA polymerase sigma factor (TIGR02999 family)